MILVPETRGSFGGLTYVRPGAPWLVKQMAGRPIWFCSADCHEKGEAQPVRDLLEAHVDWERGTKVSPERMCGRFDALRGYDCVGDRPEYVKGHGEGMAIRPIIEAASKRLAEMADPK